MNKYRTFLLSVVAAIPLILGCFHLPIGYYTFLRIVVFIVSVILLFCPKSESVTYRHIVNGLVAILFNPIIPIYLHSKTVWTVIDAAVAVWFVVQSLLSYKNSDKELQL